MTTTRTIAQHPAEQPQSVVLYKGEERSFRGDHPMLAPLCAPPIFFEFRESLRTGRPVVVESPKAVSGEFMAK